MAPSDSLVPDYAIRYKNNTVSTFELFDAEIQPPNSAGNVPPKDFKLHPDKEYTLTWVYHPESPERGGKTFGYVRFWSIHSTPHELGSGLVFGVKVEEEFFPTGVSVPKVFTYVGSPTGNPNAWTEVTSDLDKGYTFKVKGTNITVYDVTLKTLPPGERPVHVSRIFLDATIQGYYI